MSRKKRPVFLIAIPLLLALFPCWFVWRQNQDTTNEQRLFEAIHSNDASRVIALRKAGADPNKRTRFGVTYPR